MRVLYIAPFICLALSSVTKAEVLLFEDTFETSPEGNLSGQSLSSDNAMYSVSAQGATFKRGDAQEIGNGDQGAFLGRFYNNPGEANTAWVTISTDFDSQTDYEFSIGYINFSGYGTFAIKVGGTASDLKGSYQFIYANSKSIDVIFTDIEGERHQIGHVIPENSQKQYSFGLRDIRIKVSGNRQRLLINGEPYGEEFSTEGEHSDGMMDQIRLYTQPTNEAFDIGIDNIKAISAPQS